MKNVPILDSSTQKKNQGARVVGSVAFSVGLLSCGDGEIRDTDYIQNQGGTDTNSALVREKAPDTSVGIPIIGSPTAPIIAGPSGQAQTINAPTIGIGAGRPVSSSIYIEIPHLVGSSISIRKLNGATVANGVLSGSTFTYPMSSFSPSVGGDEFVVIRITGGYNNDFNGDGVANEGHVNLQGSFDIIVPRTRLEYGGKLILNPRMGLLTKSVLSRVNPLISKESLDAVTKANGTTDANNDGIINYTDTLTSNTENVSPTPMLSGYISAIHSNDQAQEQTAVENVLKRENHIISDIVSSTDMNSHDPMLRLRSISGDGMILYTLDGSSPLPESPTTFRTSKEVRVAFQERKIYYRELFTLSGKQILGRVKGISLTEDLIGLSQESQVYNPNSKETSNTSNHSYKGYGYSITTRSNVFSSGYTFPMTVDCQVGSNKSTGCFYGPYIAYTQEHLDRIQSLIHQAAQRFIDTGINIPIMRESPLQVIENMSMYRNSYYSVYNDWMINATTGKREYPVRVWGRYLMTNGALQVVEGGNVDSEASRLSGNANLTARLKGLIDQQEGVSGNNSGGSNQDRYTPGFQETVTPSRVYAGGRITTVIRYSSTAGADYPATLTTTYTLSNGTQGSILGMINSESTKNTDILGLEERAKLEIDNFPLLAGNTTTNSAITTYGSKGGSYQFFATYNRKGNGYNYPALFWVQYWSGGRLYDSRNTYGLTEARNSEHKEQIRVQLEQWVRGQILVMNSAPQYTSSQGNNILSILMKDAYAAPTPTINVGNNATKVSPFAPYNTTTLYGQYFGAGKVNTLYTSFVEKSPNVSAINQTSLEDKRILREIDAKLKKFERIMADIKNSGICTGAGSTIAIKDDCYNKASAGIELGRILAREIAAYIRKTGRATMLYVGENLSQGYVDATLTLHIEELLKYKENALLMYALIHEEQSHLSPPFIEDLVPSGNTFGLSQISMYPSQSDRTNFGFRSYSKEELLNPATHIAIMNERINTIRLHLQIRKIPETAENIGSIWNGGYNCLGQTGICSSKALEYGKRIGQYSKEYDGFIKLLLRQ